MINKRIFLYYSSAIFLVLGVISCKKTDNADKILTAAEQLVEQYPDSALILLDSIPNPYVLDGKEQNRYWLLQIQAKDKLYKCIASDTAIFNVRDYYEKKNDIENIALSSFYCGRVLQEQNKQDTAMAEYLKASEYAEKTKDENLRGLSQSHIGEIFLAELLQTNAITHFNIAAQHFRKAQNIRNEIISYKLIGNAYLTESFDDSAFYYYDKGLKLAEADNDREQVAILMHNIGIAYRETGKYDLADKYFRNAIEHTTRSDDKIKLYLNLSKTFCGRGMLDSAKVYVNKSLSLLPDSDDVFIMANIHKILSQVAEKQSKFKQSLEYYKEYTCDLRKIADENKDKEILELQKKYNYERVQNENNQLKISKQKTYFLFSTIFLIICLVALFFYKKSADNKKLALQKENQILEAEKKIYQLIKMTDGYNREANLFRNLLLHHFDILKKVTLLKQYIRDDDTQSHRLVKKFNEIIYGQDSLNWDIFYQDINNIHNGLFNRIKERYPELDESEFRVCCLTHADFTCSEIGIIMGLSPNTIQMKRSSIRKKLGIESQGNIQTYLEMLFGL